MATIHRGRIPPAIRTMLDAAVRRDYPEFMIRIALISLTTAFCALADQDLPVPAQTAPPDVIESAVAAVRDLGEEVVLGRYHVAIERMNPMWKNRAARRAGGMAALEQQLQDVGRQMVRQGVSVISSRPQGDPRVFEVRPSRETRTEDGETVEEMVYREWLIFVPTVTKYRIMMEGEPRPVVIESTGFQIAVSAKNPLEWSFIDGSSVTVNDLRSMFRTLPQDLELPPIERREAR